MSEPNIFEIAVCNRRGSEAGVQMARLLAIVRLAAVCGVPSLDGGTMERVLQNDASVCGATNPSAFARLRGMLQRHQQAPKHAAERDNEAATYFIIEAIVECLRMPTSTSIPIEGKQQSLAA